MHGFLVRFAPPAVLLAELPVLVALLPLCFAGLHVAVPEIDQRHVLPSMELLVDVLKIRASISHVTANRAGAAAVDLCGDPVVGDSLRQREIQTFAPLECPQNVIDARLADAKLSGDLASGHSQSEVFDDDVFVVQHCTVLLKKYFC